mmetsp:Transcript_130660/g.418212  ORF Transcript_130660/g.418212 Transcript_130660/m.418212 type:complete len:287 (+) Transcript_130660:1196-2056(+)
MRQSVAVWPHLQGRLWRAVREVCAVLPSEPEVLFQHGVAERFAGEVVPAGLRSHFRPQDARWLYGDRAGEWRPHGNPRKVLSSVPEPGAPGASLQRIGQGAAQAHRRREEGTGAAAPTGAVPGGAPGHRPGHRPDGGALDGRGQLVCLPQRTPLLHRGVWRRHAGVYLPGVWGSGRGWLAQLAPRQRLRCRLRRRRCRSPGLAGHGRSLSISLPGVFAEIALLGALKQAGEGIRGTRVVLRLVSFLPSGGASSSTEHCGQTLSRRFSRSRPGPTDIAKMCPVVSRL